MNQPLDNYVLYHAHCTDGTGAKYAAWKALGKSAQYIAVNYNQPPPPMNKGSNVFIVDFSYPKEVLQQLELDHAKVMVLDHHKSAEEQLKGMTCCHFDMNKSGCVLSWEYFHPGIPVPNLLLDIQDRDLWKWKRSHSKAVHAGLSLLKGNMELWNMVASSQTDYLELVGQGQVLIQRDAQLVESAVTNKVKVIDFMGYKVGVINTTDLMSEIGNGICESKKLSVDFAMCYGITNTNNVLLSLRSIGDFDVTVIAKKFGGGGHKNASGAQITLNTLVKILNGNM